jgi:hypothetical protein
MLNNFAAFQSHKYYDVLLHLVGIASTIALVDAPAGQKALLGVEELTASIAVTIPTTVPGSSCRTSASSCK